MFRNQVQLINYIERQSALFFSKMFVDHRSFFFCQKTKEISRNVIIKRISKKWNSHIKTNRLFSHDVKAAIFVYKTMDRHPCLCTKNPVELNSFHMLKLSFINSKQFAKLLTTRLKTIYSETSDYFLSVLTHFKEKIPQKKLIIRLNWCTTTHGLGYIDQGPYQNQIRYTLLHQLSRRMDRCCKLEGLCCGLRTNLSESSLAYENPSICSGQSLKTMITNHSLIIINQRHQAHRRGRRHATSVTLSTSSPQQIF